MFLAYCRARFDAQTLVLYERMKRESFAFPTRLTYEFVVSACTALGSFDKGRSVHVESMAMSGFGESSSRGTLHDGLGATLDCAYGTTLVTMYSRCGDLQAARAVFQSMQLRDVCTWTSLITGYARNGEPDDAMELFKSMELEGMEPNEVTFTALLNACSHAGLHEQGGEFFRLMLGDHGRELKHYGAMVDLLARVGRLQDAEDLINSMPYEPSQVFWNSLLSACRMHKDVFRAARVADIVSKLNPDCSSPLVQQLSMLSSIILQGRC